MGVNQIHINDINALTQRVYICSLRYSIAYTYIRTMLFANKACVSAYSIHDYNYIECRSGTEQSKWIKWHRWKCEMFNTVDVWEFQFHFCLPFHSYRLFSPSPSVSLSLLTISCSTFPLHLRLKYVVCILYMSVGCTYKILICIAAQVGKNHSVLQQPKIYANYMSFILNIHEFCRWCGDIDIHKKVIDL